MASGSATIDIRKAVTGRSGFDAWQRALADAHREAKKTREAARYLDQKLAILEDATFALLGIATVRQPKEGNRND